MRCDPAPINLLELVLRPRPSGALGRTTEKQHADKLDLMRRSVLRGVRLTYSLIWRQP